MKTKEKTNPMNQEAINAIARNVYIAELFSKASGAARIPSSSRSDGSLRRRSRPSAG